MQVPTEAENCDKVLLSPTSRAAHINAGEIFGTDPSIPTQSVGGLKAMDVDMDEAMRMAYMASVSYCRNFTHVKDWTCARCLRPEIQGFLTKGAFYIPGWELFAYIGYFNTSKEIAIVFRLVLYLSFT